MKETLLRILRMTSLNNQQKLANILEVLKEDNSEYYGTNSLVKMERDEFKKLNRMYGTQVTKNMIESIDAYVYKTGKNYRSHYLTIINWCNKAGIKKVRQMYQCSYGINHYKGDDCTCDNF